MTPKEQSLLDVMLEEARAAQWEGDVWVEVYLDNIPLRRENPRLFAALCSNLAQKGLYRPVDDAWGLVRLEEPRP